MTKKVFYLLGLLFLELIYQPSLHVQEEGRVGVNNVEPKATLDVKAYSSTGNRAEGLLVPRVSKQKAQDMAENTETSALIWVDDVSSGTGKAVEYVTEVGYYYFDGERWARLGSGQAQPTNLLSANYVGANGVWMQNLPTENNTIQFRVNNYSDANFAGLDFNNALRLNGASQGLQYEPAQDYSKISITAGEDVLLVYNVKGVPASYGTLTANFSALNGSVKAFGTVQIQEQSQVKALSIKFEGEYIANKAFNHTQKLTLRVRNFSNQPVRNSDLSQLINLSGIDGVKVTPRQNTNVNIGVGQEVALAYNLEGVPYGAGNLLAVFQSNEVVSGNVNATQEVSLFSNASCT